MLYVTCIYLIMVFRTFMQTLATPKAAVAQPRAPCTPRDFMDKNTETTRRFNGMPYMFLQKRKSREKVMRKFTSKTFEDTNFISRKIASRWIYVG